MSAFDFIWAKIVARSSCALGVRSDFPVAKITLVVCGPEVSSGQDACCTGFGVVFLLVLPVTSPGASSRGLGIATFANNGAAGGREDFIGGGGVLVSTLVRGFAGGTGAEMLLAIFVDGRAEEVSLRVGLRALLTLTLLIGFRFNTERRLRNSLGGTSFTVSASLSRRARFKGGRGVNILLTGIRLGGAKSRSPELGIGIRKMVSVLRLVTLSPKTLRSTSTLFE